MLVTPSILILGKKLSEQNLYNHKDYSFQTVYLDKQTARQSRIQPVYTEDRPSGYPKRQVQLAGHAIKTSRRAVHTARYTAKQSDRQFRHTNKQSGQLSR